MGDYVVMRCHCGQLSEAVQLRYSIPVDNLLCHCNTCRRVTGALTFTGIALVSPPEEAFKTKLTKYATSEKIWRYFCETCGSHVCYYTVKEDRWSVCSGAIDQIVGQKKGRLEKITEHEFAGDTGDSGLIPLFPGTAIYWEDEGGQLVTDLKSELDRHQSNAASGQDSDNLEIACRCGEVHLSLSRPDSSDAHSRWDAGLCVCRSCRLSFGQSIVPWVFNVPFAKARWSGGTVHDGGIHKSLSRFQSSDHAYRDFCKTCGASVFYYSSRQSGLMDIAFGLLRAQEGSLAKSWIKWETGKIHHAEDAVDEDLIKGIRQNLKSLQDA